MDPAPRTDTAGKHQSTVQGFGSVPLDLVCAGWCPLMPMPCTCTSDQYPTLGGNSLGDGKPILTKLP